MRQVSRSLARPVTGVNHLQAQRFAKWLGLRLPTEAEWLKAARATGGRTSVPGSVGALEGILMEPPEWTEEGTVGGKAPSGVAATTSNPAAQSVAGLRLARTRPAGSDGRK